MGARKESFIIIDGWWNLHYYWSFLKKQVDSIKGIENLVHNTNINPSRQMLSISYTKYFRCIVGGTPGRPYALKIFWASFHSQHGFSVALCQSGPYAHVIVCLR